MKVFTNEHATEKDDEKFILSLTKNEAAVILKALDMMPPGTHPMGSPLGDYMLTQLENKLAIF